MSSPEKISEADVVAFLQSRVRFYNTALNAFPSARIANSSALQNEIDNINRPLALLRQHRNALLSPISRLAPEILSLIFHHLAQLEPHFCPCPEKDLVNYMKEKSTLPFALGWARVAQVSATWRTCALSDATLWATVTLAHGRSWAEEMLRRSGCAPIKLQIIASRQSEAHFAVETIRREAERIAELDLIVDHDSFSSHFITLAIEGSLPLLKRVNICSPRGSHAMSDWHNITTPAIATAGLDSLRIHDCNELDWRELFMTSLTSLVVDCCIYLSADPLSHSVNTIRDALSRTTRLEMLSIRDSFMEVSGTLNLPPVDLFQLKTLELNTSLLGLAALVGCLRAPHCHRIKLETFKAERVPAEEQRSLSSLGHALAGTQLPIYHLKTLECKTVGPKDSRTRSFCISGWDSSTISALMHDFEQEGDEVTPAPNLSIIVRLPPGAQSHGIRSAPFLDNLPLGQVVNLSFNVAKELGHSWNYVQWDHLLPRCLSLRWLRVDRDVALDLLRQHSVSMRLGNGCFIPRSVEVIALFCVQWDDSVRGISRADALAGELWGACSDDVHQLEGLMIGEDAFDENSLYTNGCFSSDICSDIDLLRSPDRPRRKDEDGDTDEEWLDEMYAWDPLWRT
ncbi:hypothetical protein PENSPDRAFT_645394 [Peniophora sp. CONT]|nr:hypothetical protein PENSPDRAFT_645394 [Peniophora sp. CONT]